VWSWPKTQYVTLENRVQTVVESEQDSIVISRSVCGNTITCEGIIRQESPTVSEQVAVAGPSLYAATVLNEVLELEGVEVRGKPARQVGIETRTDTTRVTEHVSPPLREIIRRVNKESDNLCAEALLRTLGRELRDRGDSGAGLEAVREFALSSGVDSTSIVLADGSGLSRLNAISASAVTQFLGTLSKHAEFSEFFQSLAIAGVDGTLEERFLGSAAQGVLRGKSGSMTGVAALSGYLIDRQGRQIAFSILLNGHRSDGGSLADLVDLLAGEISGFY
jgi:PBP4 family serine-type D-alanyl-D-alanine carboxypeptidase